MTLMWKYRIYRVLNSYHPGIRQFCQTESLCHVDTGSSMAAPNILEAAVSTRFSSGDTGQHQQRPRRCGVLG